MKYNVGDKVRVISNPSVHKQYFMDDRIGVNHIVSGMCKFAGKVVTIFEIRNGQYCIKEDEGVWCWTDEMFDGLADYPKIVITTDGKTTVAKMYGGKNVLRSAEARCNPKDTFDFAFGAKLAMERLIGESEKINVGDVVKVADGGYAYSTYVKWFEGRGHEDLLPYYQYGNRVKDGTFGVVVAAGDHLRGPDDDYLCAIQDGSRRVYLVSVRGIEKCQR